MCGGRVRSGVFIGRCEGPAFFSVFRDRGKGLGRAAWHGAQAGARARRSMRPVERHAGQHDARSEHKDPAARVHAARMAPAARELKGRWSYVKARSIVLDDLSL